MLEVRLTEAETRIGQWVGKMRFKNRHEAKGREGLGNGPSKDEHTPVLAIRGALCEMACAKMLNLYWAPIVEFFEREPDVGGLVEVRSIINPQHRLPIKPWEDDHPFALIYTDEIRYYSFRGWMTAAEAMAIRELTVYPGADPAHYVEQTALHDAASLMSLLAHRLQQPPPHPIPCQVRQVDAP